MGRTRADINAQLNEYYHLVDKTILRYQDPVTGLLPGFVTQDGSVSTDAWVRDNVYGILAVWGLSMVYKKRSEIQDYKANAFELEQRVVKLMRGLLFSMMKQAHKVEAFKSKRSTGSSLHAKYNIKTGDTVVGDNEWGHLQLDATSLYILMVAQMTASGLQIVFTLDEVSFIQNLVFYIESAYVTPDYGLWERGDKTNNGQPELNASSIGMAKAAMEAINGLDLFGSRGGPSSVIHVLPDEIQQCNTKLMSLLPRESSSKEIDAGLLSIIGYPAFAVDSVDMINTVRKSVSEKLQGKYGCKRFLRDGYQTVKEDSSRLYYEPAELKVFENIECEWPLFFCYFYIDATFREDKRDANKYKKAIHKLALHDEEDYTLTQIPELYYVPYDKTDMEYQHPHSQERCPGRKRQTTWAQSLFILGELLYDNLIVIGEIDPLNRRFCTQAKPDLIIQVSLLAEDAEVASTLEKYNIKVQTIKQVQRCHPRPIQVLASRHLSYAYRSLGICDKMKLSGRPYHPMGPLGTCQIYEVSGNLYVFIPQYIDQEMFYFSLDSRMVVELIKTQLAYLKYSWKQMGRPTFPIPILRSMIDVDNFEKSAMMKLLQAFMSGYSTGVKVKVGFLNEFLSTSCITKLTFLESLSAVGHLSVKHKDSAIFLLSKDDSFDRSDKKSLLARGSVRRSRQGGILDSPIVARRAMGRTGSSGLLKFSSPTQASITRRNSFQGSSIAQLAEELKTSVSISDKADVLHYLYTTFGKTCTISVDGKEYSVENLLEELYDKVCRLHSWCLVRHVAGLLDKKVEGLAQAATDLLVQQKQFSVGSPSARKEIAVSQPKHADELFDMIKQSCAGDYSAIAITQEILVYLAMLVRAEPSLFREMLRLRIGLIYEVMIFELSRALDCPAEEAHEELLNLSPSELKNLMHYILSGKEFRIDQDMDQSNVTSTSDLLLESQLSIVSPSKKDMHGQLYKEVLAMDQGHDEDIDREGQWRRRRRLDGALNRLPPNFYVLVWHILERCSGIQIKTHYLPSHPTVQEMTPSELKFALKVEALLNTVDDPEYRQLIVEVLMILSLVVNEDPAQPLGHTIVVDHILKDANNLFVENQRHQEHGYSKDCCCQQEGKCGGHEKICVHFYDSAPSGRYGTMSYISQAVANKLKHMPSPSGNCQVS
ncbi:phosphorylase b kinase regulatory subunit alpha, liver isoform-like [Dysidea avara]|uniref:phosphorylase b kinase regulatory subunit alpha, liver isoform-like n=1 Tax=Dysidea avara TaxID=196820 RepID=UPI003319B0A6